MSDFGQLVVLCGPSGCGKSTLVARVQRSIPDLVFSVSSTTRSPRDGEVDGEHYHFLDEPAFLKEVHGGGFLEHARVHGNLYGTHRRHVEKLLRQGKTVLLDIDVQGARQVRAGGVQALSIFLMPPSIKELERRLRGRGTDDESVIVRRLAVAADEMGEAPLFDHVVVNDDLNRAEAELAALLLRVPNRAGQVP